MIAHILMFWFKTFDSENTVISFLKKNLQNADLHKRVLNKIMTT